MSTTPLSLTPEQIVASESAQWKTILSRALADLRVSIPAFVAAFDPAKQVITAQIVIQETVKTPTGPQQATIKPIANVPVCFPSGGGACITWPLKFGDEGLLVFTDMCFDLWWVRGGIQAQLERRRHDLTDCFFIPGGVSQPNAIPNFSTNSLQVRTLDGRSIVDVSSSGITLTSPKVTINSSGDVDIIAQGNVNISGQKIMETSSQNNTTIDGKTFLTHLHTGVSSGQSDTGPVA